MPLVDMSKSAEVPSGEDNGLSKPVPFRALTNLVGDVIYFRWFGSEGTLVIAFFRSVVYHMALRASVDTRLETEVSLYKSPLEEAGQATAIAMSS